MNDTMKRAGAHELSRFAFHRGRDGRHFCLNPCNGRFIVTNDDGWAILNSYGEGPEGHVSEMAARWGVSPSEARTRLESFFDTIKRIELLSNPDIADCGQDKIPFMSSVLFEVTYRCNFKCKGCDAGAHHPRKNELTTDELKGLIDVFIELGSSPISFTGGEPLLREDIFELYEHVRSKGGQPVLATNGALVTSEVARKLKELNIFVQVGLDGSTAEINDANRGKDTFDKVMRGIENLQKEGVPYRISAVITKQNHTDVGNVADLAYRHGSTATIFRKLHVLGRAPEHPEVVPDTDEMLTAFRLIFNKTLEYMGKMVVDLPYQRAFFGGRGPSPERMICIPGFANVVISPEGNIHPCARLRHGPYILGNVRNADVKDVWKNSEANRTVRALTVDDIHCTECEYRYLCGGSCRAEAFYRSGGVLERCWDCDAIRSYYDFMIDHFLESLEPAVP